MKRATATGLHAGAKGIFATVLVCDRVLLRWPVSLRLNMMTNSKSWGPSAGRHGAAGVPGSCPRQQGAVPVRGHRDRQHAPAKCTADHQGLAQLLPLFHSVLFSFWGCKGILLFGFGPQIKLASRHQIKLDSRHDRGPDLNAACRFECGGSNRCFNNTATHT
jgi:hypothetical protein